MNVFRHALACHKVCIVGIAKSELNLKTIVPSKVCIGGIAKSELGVKTNEPSAQLLGQLDAHPESQLGGASLYRYHSCHRRPRKSRVLPGSLQYYMACVSYTTNMFPSPTRRWSLDSNRSFHHQSRSGVTSGISWPTFGNSMELVACTSAIRLLPAPSFRFLFRPSYCSRRFGVRCVEEQVLSWSETKQC